MWDIKTEYRVNLSLIWEEKQKQIPDLNSSSW